MTSARISTSSSIPGRPPKKASMISSKLNSQNGSRRLLGVSTWLLLPKHWPYSLCGFHQEDAQVRPLFQNLLQHDSDAARLADAGGAENGEMLGQQIVDLGVDADGIVLLQRADLDGV